MLNVFQPHMGPEELDAVRRVFDSGWLGRGSRTDEFELQMAERLGTKKVHVRAVSCCTAGLFLVAEQLGWGPGDEVILPTISFVGAGNAVAARGARPVFADVDERTLNPSLADIERCLTTRTRAVLLLHYGGVPCADIERIAQFCQEQKVTLVEDNACSPFSKIHGRPTGTLGDFGLWSFDAMKILVTGDGGLIYARDASEANQIGQRAYLGMDSASGLSNPNAGRWWEFELTTFGSRQIMNDITAAIGLEQLAKVDRFIERRRAIHSAYECALQGLDWLNLPPELPAGCISSHYLYWVQTEHRDALAKWLRDRQIYTTFRYHPLHRVRRYESDAHLPQAERAAARTLCLPLHQGLSDTDVDQVVEAVRRFPLP